MWHPTPDDLEDIYNLLRRQKPFRGWKLPDSDVIEFQVVRMRGQDQADCQHLGGEKHRIRIAANKHASIPPLVATMAHEMIHVHLNIAYPRDRAHHGRRFRRCADLVCRLHTFDRGQF